MASITLQKLEWENTIRTLYLKHRGDVSKIVKDLRDKYQEAVDNAGERFTLTFVKKAIQKFKRETKVNSPFVATWVLEYVLAGTRQREVHFDTDIEELEAHKFYYRSGCCDAVADSRTTPEGTPYFSCMKCSAVCQVYRAPNLSIFEMKRKLVGEKRKDEEQIVKAVDSLGFGGEKAPVVKATNYQVVFEGDRKRKHVESFTKKEKQLVEDVDALSSMDREVVISRTRQAIANIDADDKNANETSE